MAENPATWTVLEEAIDEAMDEFIESNAQDMCGLTLPATIAKVLREKDLVKEAANEPSVAKFRS